MIALIFSIAFCPELLQYSTNHEALPNLEYDLDDTIGYATKVGDATYFLPTVEYVLFLSAYLLFHFVLGMVIYHQRNKIYYKTFKYATTSRTQFALFWSGIVTFFISCFNVSFIFAIEGGACITLLQLYMVIFSLIVPVLFYPVIAFFIKKKTGFLNEPFNLKIGPRVDHAIQALVMWLLLTLPHIGVLITYLATVSFFHNASSTAFLGVYIALSTVTLWIANAISIYIVFPCFAYMLVSCRSRIFCYSVCTCYKRIIFILFKRIAFGSCLSLSINLMNFSVMPFVSDFYYDSRADGSFVLTIIPLVITVFGWYNSGKLVEVFSFSFEELTMYPKAKQESESNISPETKPVEEGRQKEPENNISAETKPKEDRPATNNTAGTEERDVKITIEDDSTIAATGNNSGPSNHHSSNKFYNLVRAAQYFHRLNSKSQGATEENDLSDESPSSTLRVRTQHTSTV